MSLNEERSEEITALQTEPRPVRIDEEGRIFEMSGEQLKLPGLACGRTFGKRSLTSRQVGSDL